MYFIIQCFVFNCRTIRGEVVVPSKPLRPAFAGNPRRLQQQQQQQRRRLQRRSVMYRAAHSYDPRRAQRGDGQDFLQPRNERTVGQVPWTRHGNDHHKIRKVSLHYFTFHIFKTRIRICLVDSFSRPIFLEDSCE